jgi:outer membrane protein assembly factor BamB
MTNTDRRAAGAIIVGTLCTVLALAQAGPSSKGLLRTAPTETLTVNPGFRDWGPTTIAGTTILAGNSTNKGGLFAVDTLTGKLKWTSRPAALRYGLSVSTAPAVSGDVVVTPMGNTLVAVSLATGKEMWRGPQAAQSASVVASFGLAYVLGDDNTLYALDAITGKEKWKRAFARFVGCESRPVVRDGIVYVSGTVLLKPADAIMSATYYGHLFALDANTGEERWRYPSTPVGITGGLCFTQPVVTADTFFAIVSTNLYALDVANGRERWGGPLEVRRSVEGRVRGVNVEGLVDAGSVLVGLTPGYLIAFDKASGKTAWEIQGQYSPSRPSTAVAGRVLYFQGHPGAEPAAAVQGSIVYQGGRPIVSAPVLPGGRLNALDLDTRAILWSFSRPTAEANWPFGYVTPVEGGLWVDSYQALVKLETRK